MEVSEEFIKGEVERLRKNFNTKKTYPVKWRKTQLQQLSTMLKNHRKELAESINKDLHTPPQLVNLVEIGSCIQEINLVLSKIDQWVAPEKRKTPLSSKPSSGSIHKQPYGVVLIISPWNYPIRLTLMPLIGAIAAGNAVVVKPSEMSANISATLKKLLLQYLDNDFISVIYGDIPVATSLLAQRFDYIFYTGNTEVGKIVMKAASNHLTPVTLELGGKCPVIVDKSCNLDVTVNRILAGKVSNSGQTCIAPDYVIVHKDIKEKLLKTFIKRAQEWYTDTDKSPYFSRIINERHTLRIQNYLEEVKDKIVFGGKVDTINSYVEPTIIDEPPLDSKVMREEIFGPVLPIVTFSSTEEVIDHVNQREKPLALYIFADDGDFVDEVVENTSSGGVSVNQVIIHVICPDLEFGGVGHSGMGSYNGYKTFETFSHRRSVFKKSTRVEPMIAYPPFNEDKLNVLSGLADGDYSISTIFKLLGS